MNGKEKIEKLTHSWYGFAIFAAVASIFMNGIGIFSIIGAVISTFVSFVLTFLFGRWLLGKSSFTRYFLIVVSGLVSILGILGVGQALYTFFTEWTFGILLNFALASVSIYMNVKYFSVLTDKSVKAYFA